MQRRVNAKVSDRPQESMSNSQNLNTVLLHRRGVTQPCVISGEKMWLFLGREVSRVPGPKAGVSFSVLQAHTRPGGRWGPYYY